MESSEARLRLFRFNDVPEVPSVQNTTPTPGTEVVSYLEAKDTAALYARGMSDAYAHVGSEHIELIRANGGGDFRVNVITNRDGKYSSKDIGSLRAIIADDRDVAVKLVAVREDTARKPSLHHVEISKPHP